MGHVLQAGQGQIPSRQAQIQAGIPKEVSSETINKVCASGLRASVLLDQASRAGDVEVGVGGGMESMSRAPYLLPQARFGYRMGDAKALDAMVTTASPTLQRPPDVRRGDRDRRRACHAPDLDRWLRSHERAIAATDEPPARGRRRHGQGSQGRHRRRNRRGPAAHTTLELASLPGLVGKEGSHTAGNSPGVNDGGGASCWRATSGPPAHGKTALAEIVAYRNRRRLRLSGHHAGRRRPEALAKAALRCGHRPVGDQRGVRIRGAAFDQAAGHRRGQGQRQRRRVAGPSIGASGADLGALVHELRAAGRLGCAAICSGGGQGDAVILKVHPNGA
jgi:acetyl-CoA C-acetyltransferase